MKKNKPRINMPLGFASIILCCSFLILTNCIGKTDFERNIDFDDGWHQISNAYQTKKKTLFQKEFELNVQNDKVYLLQVSSPENILKLQVNNTVVTGIRDKNNVIDYNITDQLKEQNTIELTKLSTSYFEAKIHCINKLFIPAINLKFNGKNATVYIKVKNSFSTEKQGTLEYALYSGEDEKLEIKETPVFISGNAENIYHQQFKINLQDTNTEGLHVVCKLYSNGKLFDKNIDDL